MLTASFLCVFALIVWCQKAFFHYQSHDVTLKTRLREMALLTTQKVPFQGLTQSLQKLQLKHGRQLGKSTSPTFQS